MKIRTLLQISALLSMVIIVVIAGYGYKVAHDIDTFASQPLHKGIAATQDIENASRALLHALWLTNTALNADASQMGQIQSAVQTQFALVRGSLDNTFNYMANIGKKSPEAQSTLAANISALEGISSKLFGTRTEQSHLMEALDEKIVEIVESHEESLEKAEIHMLWSLAMAANDYAAYGQPDPAKEFVENAPKVREHIFASGIGIEVNSAVDIAENLMQKSQVIFTSLEELKTLGNTVQKTLEEIHHGSEGVKASLDKVQGQFYTLAAQAQTSMLFMGAMGFILIFVTLMFVYKAVQTPLFRLSRYFESISQGHLDTPMQSLHRYEFDVLLGYAQNMVGALKHTIEEATARTKEAHDAAAQSAEALSQADEAMKKGERARSEGVHYAASQIGHVAKAIEQATATLEAYMQEASAATSAQRYNVEQSRTLVEFVEESAHLVQRYAMQAATITERSSADAQQGSGRMQSISQDVQAIFSQSAQLQKSMEILGNHAESIGGIMVTISDIADQTNLLALNAAIEAARAGDAGRGFAVVADEVRKLAEKTMLATGEVDRVIRSIQSTTSGTAKQAQQVGEGIGTIAEHTHNASDALTSIAQGVQESVTLVQEIVRASQEQTQRTGQMNEAVSSIEQLSSRASSTILQAAHSTKDMTAQAHILGQVLQKMAVPQKG